MAEPRQFSTIFSGIVGGSIQASDSPTTAIAAAATPVVNANTWATTGDLNQVLNATPALEADHANGARSFQVSFHGRVQKDAGAAGDVTVHVYLNGSPLANPLNRCVFCDPADPASEFQMTGAVDLVDGDQIAVYLENVDDDEDLVLIEGATLTIKS